jgi:hypothetical protein
MATRVIPSTYTFIFAAVVGLALGGILSLIFGRLAVPAGTLQSAVFGISIGQLLANIVLITVIGAIVFLGYVSMVVQDTAFPSKHPWLFALETVIVGFLPASILYVITDIRDNGKLDLTSLNRDFVLLAAKFSVFHLLFQFSGLYTYMLGSHA